MDDVKTDLFTIQNVPIKFNDDEAVKFTSTYLQYKMFLLNETFSSQLFDELKKFTIQNVPIK